MFVEIGEKNRNFLLIFMQTTGASWNICCCQTWHQCQLFGILALDQNWPSVTHMRATNLARAHPMAAVVYKYTEKNDWFIVWCLKNDGF